MKTARTRTTVPPTGEVYQLAEHLFRHESGRLVSILTGIFGSSRIQLAEDVVQEAMVRAMQTWPYYGIPENPAAWLTQTARNLVYDVLRREKIFLDKEGDIAATMVHSHFGNSQNGTVRFESEVQDDTLRLMFICCHPAIGQESQTALALKTLCGFGVPEIASAFLTTEAAIAKRLTRARQKIQELKIPFEIPAGAELSARLEGVHKTLYLMFSEGYKASSGDNLVREDMCSEALRLILLLARHLAGNVPETHALAALVLLNSARLPARVDANGKMSLLKDQDRSRWNTDLIKQGMIHLEKSAAGDRLSEYHIQAAIAAFHCMAHTYEDTDWKGILGLYDQWVRMDDSPVIALNRAVAVANVHGIQSGLDTIASIPDRKRLESYYLYYAVMGEFHIQLGDFKSGASNLRKAFSLIDVKSERELLAGKLETADLNRSL